MNTRARVSAYLDYCRAHGVAVGLALAVHRLLSGIGESWGLFWYRFYRQPLTTPAAKRSAGGLDLYWLDQYDDILHQLPRPLANIKARFAQNVRCLVAVKGGHLIACAWFAFARYDEDEVRCTYLLPDNAVWDFDIFVTPEYRMSRVFLKTWQHANDTLAREGYAYSLSRISAFNHKSISAHEKLGAERVGNALFLKLGAVQIMVADRRPRVSISLPRSNAPAIDFAKEGDRGT